MTWLWWLCPSRLAIEGSFVLQSDHVRLSARLYIVHRTWEAPTIDMGSTAIQKESLFVCLSWFRGVAVAVACVCLCEVCRGLAGRCCSLLGRALVGLSWAVNASKKKKKRALMSDSYN